MALPNHNAWDFKGMELRCDQVTATTSLTVAGNTVTGAEFAAVDGVTAGVVTASKAVIVDANKDVGDFRNVDVVNLDAGASGTAGTVDVFPATAAKGKLTLSCTNQTGDTIVTLNANAMGQATQVNIADPGAAASYVAQSTAALTLAEVDVLDAVVAGTASASKALVLGATKNVDTIDVGQAGLKVDAVVVSPIKWVDVAATAALLDAAGTAPVIAGVAGDQYKIREVILVGGGTNFGAGGDRTIVLTDGTTTWTTIANADIETAPATSLRWGDAKVPFATGTSNTASVAGQAIRFAYAGGTTDHTTGSITFSVCLEKVA